MPFYFGKSGDGSDAQEFNGEGIFHSPTGKYWGTQPISVEDELEMNKYFIDTRKVKVIRVKNKCQHSNRKIRRGLKFGYKVK